MDSANDMLPKPSSAVKAERKRDAVLVLGMHRTGTSALSGVVHMLGVSAPKHLEPGNEFNAKGYWESQPIMRLNDRILQAVGSNWRDWSAFDEGRLASAARSEFEAELAEVIAGEYGDSRLILLKDPRICRMAPFWLRGLDRAGIVPRIAISIRNPLESAMSLLDRDEIPVREGLLLWLRHVLDAERFTRGRDRCFVPYAELLNDWRSVADKLSRTLHVAWPTAPSAARSKIDRFLSREHRHHQSSYQDLEVRPDVFDWVLATYDAVTKLSASRESETQYFERLDDISRDFDRASRVFGALVLQKNAQIDDYSRQLDERSRQAVELEGRLKQTEQQLADEIATSAQMRDEAREAVDRLQWEGSAALEQVAKLAAGTKTIEAALAQRTEEAERYRADLEALRASSSAREAELAARALEALAKADELHADQQQADRELILARIALLKAQRDSRAPRGGVASRILAKFRDRIRRPAGAKSRREAQQAELVLASGLFDPAWYLETYRDVRDAGFDPATHYLRHGWKEDRNPSARFCGPAYQQRYLDVAEAGINPLVHFLEFGINEQRQVDPVPSAQRDVLQKAGPELRLLADGRLTSEHAKFTHRGDGYEDFDPTILDGTQPDVKVLAFYLPQFHAIPENDEFWGKGFTEWRQVARGLPRFPGHYQPRVPGDLGFYDLTDEAVMHRQAELAKAAGIHGFGFYYYWFDGHRVLEQPVERFLAASDIEMPFMLIWANENWTRTWDGLNGEILLRQSYNPKDEAALLADLARHFADPRYIRLDGRPFFIIYQPRHVPDARQTFTRWRAYWKDEFGLEPAIFMAQTFGVEDPRAFGLDGAIEFPPHKLTNYFPGRPVPEAFSPGFSGRVIKYDDIAATS